MQHVVRNPRVYSPFALRFVRCGHSNSFCLRPFRSMPYIMPVLHLTTTPLVSACATHSPNMEATRLLRQHASLVGTLLAKQLGHLCMPLAAGCQQRRMPATPLDTTASKHQSIRQRASRRRRKRHKRRKLQVARTTRACLTRTLPLSWGLAFSMSALSSQSTCRVTRNGSPSSHGS